MNERYQRWLAAFTRIAREGWPKPAPESSCMCPGCVSYRDSIMQAIAASGVPFGSAIVVCTVPPLVLPASSTEARK